MKSTESKKAKGVLQNYEAWWPVLTESFKHLSLPATPLSGGE